MVSHGLVYLNSWFCQVASHRVNDHNLLLFLLSVGGHLGCTILAVALKLSRTFLPKSLVRFCFHLLWVKPGSGAAGPCSEVFEFMRTFQRCCAKCACLPAMPRAPASFSCCLKYWFLSWHGTLLPLQGEGLFVHRPSPTASVSLHKSWSFFGHYLIWLWEMSCLANLAINLN